MIKIFRLLPDLKELIQRRLQILFILNIYDFVHVE